MAFNKRIWKGRQGTGLNKFSINGATPVTVINQPDSVTEQGDALSAGNLNDLEDRISTAFEDEATARANADSDLKDAIDNNSQRIENLEVAVSGSLVQTNTDSTMANTKTITNANEILPWAILKRVGARAVAWNQLIQNGNFVSTQNWTSNTPNEGPLSASSNIGKITLTSSVSSAGIYQNVNTISGHRILLHFRYKVTTSVANPRVRVAFSNGGSGDEFTETCTSGVWHEVSRGIELTDSWSRFYILSSYGVTYATGDTFEFSDVFLHDLTTMSMASISADQFRAKFPASYYPYDTGHIYDLNPSGMKVVGFNKWDEQWENGLLNIVNGQPEDNANYSRSKNFCECTPLTDYYLHNQTSGISQIMILWYDHEKNYLTYTHVQIPTIQSVANAYYFKLRFNAGSFVGNLCLNISLPSATYPMSPHNGDYRAYQKTTIDTSFMQGKKYVNPSCYDYAENVYVDGILKRKDVVKVESLVIDQTTNLNPISTSTGIRCSYTGGVQAKNPTRLISSYLPQINWSQLVNGEKGIAINDTGLTIGFAIEGLDTLEAVKSYLTNNPLTVYYEKETYTETITEPPIPNFPCEDGTTVQAVTPQTDLVNAIDVPSTIAYMTKISS